MKILILDTYYDDVLRLPNLTVMSYTARMEDLVSLYFGTSTFYSDFFRSEGWEAIDVVANDTLGRKLWSHEHGRPWTSNLESVIDQIITERPNIVYCQDLCFLPPEVVIRLRSQGIHCVAQHSCPWAGDERVRAFEIVFTSFPHYMERIKSAKGRPEFLEIGFGKQVLNKVGTRKRSRDVVFVGGLNGSGGHWSKGTEAVDQVARMSEGKFKFEWWGYVIGGFENLPPALRASYQGPAWGLRMYEIYAEAKFVFNRHGEVADGWANNMRLFEATGMGACLLTDGTRGIRNYFEPDLECILYRDKDDHLDTRICELLELEPWRARIAERGHERTMRHHTYEKRLAGIESKLKEICG